MSIADKLNKLLNTKYAIKHAIMNKGVDIDDDTKFSDYPSKIDAIVTGGSGDSGGSYYETLYNQRTNYETDMSYLFTYSPASFLDVSELDTSNVTTMYYMFSNCKSLTTLDLSNFNTSNVTNMSCMFGYNTNLTSINGIEYFDTRNVTTMENMFTYAKLTTLDVSNFDTGNVTTMKNMFSNCELLTTLDVSNFNTSKVTDMSYMFYNCENLTTLDVSNFDTGNVTTMYYMFSNCKSLTTLDVSNFNTSNVTTMGSMFAYNTSLTTLNMNNCDISKCTSSTSLSNMFSNSTALVDFQAPQNISAPMDVSKSTLLSHDSLMSIINNLMTTTSTKKLTLGTTNLAKLTEEEKAIATGKGWTLA